MMRQHPLRAIAVVALIAGAAFAQEEADKKAGATTSRMRDVEEMSARPAPVIPTPQETYWGKGVLSVGAKNRCACAVEVRGGESSLSALPEEFFKRVRRRFGASADSGPGAVRFLFTLHPADAPGGGKRIEQRLATVGKEGYVLQAGMHQARPYVLVAGNSGAALWRGMATVMQLLSRKGDALVFPEVDIIDYPRMSERTLLVDVGGQGFMVGQSRWNLTQWEEFVDWMVDYKLNCLWIEFIGSGRLMGNLKIEEGEWIGFPLALKSYPQLVAKDRPIKRWDDAQGKVVADKYTAPNVTEDFVGRLIDYAQARGVKCYLFVGYDYFANQLPVVLGIPANDPRNAKGQQSL